MKNNLRIMLLIAVFGVIFGCAANTFAQTEVPIVGGYKEADTSDKEVVAAANFAVKAQAKKQKAKVNLVAIHTAAKQVVAGMNYQMCLSVETTDRKKKTAAPQTVQVVVYRNIKNKYSLTSWTIAACWAVAANADASPIVPTN
jgi:Cystatin domain